MHGIIDLLETRTFRPTRTKVAGIGSINSSSESGSDVKWDPSYFYLLFPLLVYSIYGVQHHMLVIGLRSILHLEVWYSKLVAQLHLQEVILSLC